MRRPIQLVLGTALVLAGCNALLDIKDITLDPNAGGEGGPEASSESSTTDSPIGSEGGTETSTCNGDLKSDKQNCGRCGHDCLGGDCTDGKCQYVALAGSLGAPEMLALDATNIYVALKRDDTVVRLAKTGGTVVTLVAGWKNVIGVALSGTTLFWSSDGTLGDAGVSGNFGGVWKCTLPACTDKKLISTVGDVRHIDVQNGWVYYATFDQVRRVKVDGTGDMTVVVVNAPFSVRADATHVYFTSAENSLGRALTPAKQ